MKNKDINTSIERAIYEAPAITFSQIADMPYIKMAHHDSITVQPEKKVFNLIRQKLVLAISFCLVAAILVSNWYVRNMVTDSVIMMDVNPSIQILMNRQNDVISVSALNEDAKFLTEEIDFKHLDLNNTINVIMNALAAHNYLNQDKRTILLSVENKDAKKADEIVNTVNNQIHLSTVNKGFSPRVLKQVISKDKSISELAKQYNVSEGKMTLIQKIVSLNNELSIDSLVSLPMEDLLQLAMDYSIDLHSIVDYDYEDEGLEDENVDNDVSDNDDGDVIDNQNPKNDAKTAEDEDSDKDSQGIRNENKKSNSQGNDDRDREDKEDDQGKVDDAQGEDDDDDARGEDDDDSQGENDDDDAQGEDDDDDAQGEDDDDSQGEDDDDDTRGEDDDDDSQGEDDDDDAWGEDDDDDSQGEDDEDSQDEDDDDDAQGEDDDDDEDNNYSGNKKYSNVKSDKNSFYYRNYEDGDQNNQNNRGKEDGNDQGENDDQD